MSPLRKRMQEAMVLRGMAARTQESYIAAVVGLAKHYRRSPEELTSEDLERYLPHLIEERKLSWSTTNQAAAAFSFLYGFTLKRDQARFRIARRKTHAQQPEILAREEVARILEACVSLRQRTLLTTTYAAGLRVSEVCALKVADIDSARMMLRVEGGKGGRDRYTLLSPRLLDLLRTHGAAYLASHPRPNRKMKAWRAIVACRTAVLGGPVTQCDACGVRRHVYHSCRNRHCPQCQTRANAAGRRWLNASVRLVTTPTSALTTM